MLEFLTRIFVNFKLEPFSRIFRGEALFLLEVSVDPVQSLR